MQLHNIERIMHLKRTNTLKGNHQTRKNIRNKYNIWLKLLLYKNSL